MANIKLGLIKHCMWERVWESSNRRSIAIEIAFFPQKRKLLGFLVQVYRKRCLCALLSLGAGTAAPLELGCCCRALLPDVWPCALMALKLGWLHLLKQDRKHER